MSVRTRWFLLGFVTGLAYMVYRTLTIDIDEYHAVRMDLHENLAVLRELIDDGRDR